LWVIRKRYGEENGSCVHHAGIRLLYLLRPQTAALPPPKYPIAVPYSCALIREIETRVRAERREKQTWTNLSPVLPPHVHPSCCPSSAASGW
jgi:hypothetical protein